MMMGNLDTATSILISITRENSRPAVRTWNTRVGVRWPEALGTTAVIGPGWRWIGGAALSHHSEFAWCVPGWSFATAGQIPIRESGSKIVSYYLPTDFAEPTNEAFGVIYFTLQAKYKI
jgi:hypothetical protein